MWQPIETAPRDGTRVLLFPDGEGKATLGWCAGEQTFFKDADAFLEYQTARMMHWWNKDLLIPEELETETRVVWEEWRGSVGMEYGDPCYDHDEIHPTHWMPLPEPPEV